MACDGDSTATVSYHSVFGWPSEVRLKCHVSSIFAYLRCGAQVGGDDGEAAVGPSAAVPTTATAAPPRAPII